jgi:hypothetical protein
MHYRYTFSKQQNNIWRLFLKYPFFISVLLLLLLLLFIFKTLTVFILDVVFIGLLIQERLFLYGTTITL